MSEKALYGKVAIVTGGGRGIGRSIALALARHGATVSLVSRTAAELKSVKAEVEAAGGTAATFQADVADEGQIRAVLRGVIERFGRLDILVNNAGIGSSKAVVDIATAEWDQVMAINARGPFILCREAIPHLQKNTPSFIVNILSIGARRCYIKNAAYAASKHALRALSIVLSQELKDTGIRVHCINPGGVATSMLDKGIANRPDLKDAKLVQPDEIADLVIYLVTHGDGGIIDELAIRRSDSNYWCFI
jgi:NAD(P)-dependent dehydrogenase (short-subunit alcohol dehydrogenase family)